MTDLEMDLMIAQAEIQKLKKELEQAVRHGRWIISKEYNDIIDMDVTKYACSACGEYRLTATGFSKATTYCPNCGAIMDGGADNGNETDS